MLGKKHSVLLHRERKFVESDSLDRNPRSPDDGCIDVELGQEQIY